MKLINLAVLLVLHLWHNQRFVSGNCTTLHVLTAATGVVRSPSEPGRDYGNNLDVCWLITNRPLKSVVIHFSKLEVESCCDNVRLYQGTSRPDDTMEAFRLSKPSDVRSLFWLKGSVLVRFKTDGSVVKTGFELTYRLETNSKMPAVGSANSVEVISAGSGVRSSHPEYSHRNYTDRRNVGWQILAAKHQLVILSIAKFDTEPNYDFLTLFPSVMPENVNETRLSGGPYYDKEFKYFGPLKLLFTSDGSHGRQGFTFMFDVVNVDHRLHVAFHRWTGKSSSDSSFSLTAWPPDSSATAQCTIHSKCGRKTAIVRPSQVTTNRSETQFRFNLPSALNHGCVGEIKCQASWRSNPTKMIEGTLVLPSVDPESVRIEPVKQELWSRTGAAQFLAESNGSCPSVRHRCELRLWNGSSMTAQQVDQRVSHPKEPQCLSSVTTRFVVVAEPQVVTVGASIACRLLSGGFNVLRLPVLDAEVAPIENPNSKFFSSGCWLRPPLVAATVAVTVALLALAAVGCALLVRAVRRGREEPTSPSNRHRISACSRNNEYAMSLNTGQNEVYMS